MPRAMDNGGRVVLPPGEKFTPYFLIDPPQRVGSRRMVIPTLAGGDTPLIISDLKLNDIVMDFCVS